MAQESDKSWRWKLLIVVEALVLVAVGVFVWWQFFQTYHYAIVDERILCRDGLRSMREFRTMVRMARPKTVVSLLDDAELVDKPFCDEAAFLQAKGIRLVRIPIELGGWPRGEQVQQFLDVVADPANRPVLVHCAQGVRRTGMLVAAYQQSVLGYDDEKTKAAIPTFGHSRRSIGDIEKFIDIYEPAGRTVTATLPKGEE